MVSKIKIVGKSLLVLISFMTITEFAQAQCCGDGVCDSISGGENAINCPYDCGSAIGFNCPPNTIGNFFSANGVPQDGTSGNGWSTTTMDANGWFYTVTGPFPKRVCLEYRVPPAGVWYELEIPCVGSFHGGSFGCNGAGNTNGQIQNWGMYDNSCALISSNLRIGGSCYTTGEIITVCWDFTAAAAACAPIKVYPIMDCGTADCTTGGASGPSGCAPFGNWSPTGSLTDLCDLTSGVGLITPPCGNHFSYLWDDPLAQTDSMATGLTPGAYTVIVTNDSLANCDTTITVVIPNITPPVFATDTINICEGESVFLEGAAQFTAGTYNDTILNGDCQNITITTLTVEAVGTCSPSSILIPNVFTPNGDGSNDVFTVDGVNLKTVEAEIYNRWGQLLYSWNDPAGFWDGRTPSAAEASEGTYFYIIKAVGLDDVKYEKEGSFSLIR